MAADTVRSLALVDGDLDVSGGTLHLLAGGAAIAQAVECALKLFRGEWFLDLDAGVPYFQDVLVKGADVNVLQGTFRAAILGVLGVTAVQVALALDRAARSLSVTWTADTDVGVLGPSTVTL